MVNFNALYISVGIIASLVVGAPVWWWQFSRERKKIEELAPESEELNSLEEDRDTQGRDSYAQERLRNLQQQYDIIDQQHRELATAHDQCEGIKERHATELAAAIARVEDIEERHATLEQQYDHVNQSYRELLAGNHAT